MLYARRAARFFERLANPVEQLQSPSGVLLYSPNLLRFVALCNYAIWVAGFINNFLLSDFFSHSFSGEKITQLFYSQLALVVVGAFGTGAVLLFARSHYRGCMLAATMLAVSSGMLVSVYMYGLNVNPHLLLAVTPLLLVGFTVGRDGLLFTAAWIVVNYVFLQLADQWGWWPQPGGISIDVVKHENLSAFVILMLIVLATEFYLVKISVTLRTQGELHQEIENKQRYQLELLSRIVTAQDEERKRIAYLLHEGPVQDMAALRLAIRNEASESETISMVDTVLTQLRTLSSNLHPATLDLYGLPSALDQLTAQHSHDGAMHIEVSHPQFGRVDPQVEIVLFRIAQEALNNVRKHSNAQHAWVRLEEGKDTISLEVRDDGLGFDVEPVQRQAVQAGHLGLAMLHELALSVGGTLRIASQPGQGATVTVLVPNPHPQPAIHSFQEQLSYRIEEHRSLT